MNLRTTLLLALILLVLAGVATVMEKNRKQARAPRTEALFPGFNIDAVDALEISSGNIKVELVKEADIWIVSSENSKPASVDLVRNILDKVDGLEGSGLVSNKAANHSVYEVDATGVEVKLTENGVPSAWFIVGKPGPDYMSSYIRLHDEDETYRVPVYLRPDVDRGGRTWRDQTILSVERANIASYTYTPDEERSVTVEQDEAGTWTVTAPENRAVQQQILDIVLSSLTDIRASGFADSVDVATAGLESPTRVLEIRARDGSAHVLEIGAENEQRQSYTRLQGEETIYLVPIGRWNTIFRKLDEIAPAPVGAGN